MSHDLVTFLLARLDEHERVARAVTSGPWRADGWHVHRTSEQEPKLASLIYDLDEEEAAHIAQYEPARVLGDIAAKRRIVDECDAVLAKFYRDDTWDPGPTSRPNSWRVGPKPARGALL